ncbi:kinesin-like protein KIF11 [Lepeophtheirus salmonis]|uniref:kinesin-like protein KIF11 n=1 Tax=Lepeophtheirus salmonis TaxID=72036 RepID=UPI001AE917D5|nr:kinesin-like protein KIF11-B [Lepeophtheirus salmonis]
MSMGTPTKKTLRSSERSQNIQVFVRARPLNKSEKASRSYSVVDTDGKKVIVKEKSNSSLTKTFSFNGVFGPDCDQRMVYVKVVRPLIDQVMQGYNCTVFAYGQTGTGKTHTMEGCHEEEVGYDNEEAGIVPRSLNDIFDGLRIMGAKDFAVRVSYLELYNEEIFDLLSDVNDTTRLRLYEDCNKKGSVIIQGLEEVQVHTKEEVYRILKKGSVKRQTAATLMNASSSRSHTVFTVTVLINQSSVGGEEMIKIGKLNLVDLAGSENIGRSGAIDKRAREAGNINQSLLTLGRVISCLVERAPHVPYRESKLTRLLQDSLGGRTKTSIIATVSPALINLEETLSTLDYAHRAKSITNKPEVNQKICKTEKLLEYTNQIYRLKSELQVAREKNGVYLTEDNYVDIIKKDESQEKEITSLIEKIKFFEDESEKIKDMFTQTKLHLEETIKERDATLSTLECTRSVLAQTNIEKEEQEYLVARQAEIECKLSKQANILLAVSDESTKDLNGVHDKLDRLRDLEARNVEVSKDFHSSFVSKYNRIEESFESQIMEQSRFCAETRDTLNNLLYKRNGHKVQTSEEFTTAMDSIASLISDIEKSVSDNIYEEQAWVNSQMKHARNAADGQQKNLQVYLTDKILPQLMSISTAIADQKSVMQETSTQIYSLVNSQVDKWEEHMTDQRKLNMESLELIKEVGISRENHSKDIDVNDNKLKESFSLLEKDYSELRKAFESFSEKIETHTSDAHKRVNENIKIRETINSEGEKMASGIEALTETSLKRSEALLYQVSQESSTTKQKQDHLLDSMNKGFDIILPAEQAISSESKEFVSKIQDDLEKKYSELESRLRGKSEKTADNLKYLNEKTQSVRSSTLDSQRLLEERLETHRSEDEKHTESLQQSINDHCKNTKAFGKLHSADMRESGRSVNHFVFQALSRDAPTSFTPIRKPPRSYPQKIIKGTPNQERLQRHRESRRGLSSVPTVDLDLVDLVEDDVDSVISANTMASEDMSGSSSSLKDSDGSRSQSISRQNSLENDLTHIKETKVIKSSIPRVNSNFRKPENGLGGARSRSTSTVRENKGQTTS